VESKEKTEGEVATPIKKGGKKNAEKLSPVYSLAVHSEALWGLNGCEDGSIKLFTIRYEEGKCHHTLKQHELVVSALELAADEKSVLSGSWDKTIAVNALLIST